MAALLFLGATPGLAANRCVTPAGKILYTDFECESIGTKREREVKDAVSVIQAPGLPKADDTKPHRKTLPTVKKHFQKSNLAPVFTVCYDPANARQDVTAGDIESAINAAVDYWNEGCNVTYVYQGICPSDHGRGDRPADYKVWWASWDNSLSVDATRSASEHAIAMASPRIGVSLNRDIDGFKFLRQYRRSVAHELGHVVGVGHSPNRDDVMFPGGANGIPTPADLDACNRAIEARYGVKYSATR